jgi:demethylmenaquinone methyltransferase/2-methoxy-6-polyprenyl-1,4-benzoquinol methylase
MDATGIGEMFSRIARHYDTLNRLFSLGSDLRWRRMLVRRTAALPGTRVLDACTGTAELAIGLAASFPEASVVGVDASEGMLAIARRKVRHKGLAGRITLIRADVLQLPFPDRAFDAAVVAFGLRNVSDRQRGVRELMRVVRPGGRLLVLEFAPPPPSFSWILFRFYLSRIIPAIGGLVSGEPRAYRYLHASVAGFLKPVDVVSLLRGQGLRAVCALPLTAGIAYLFTAEKPS